MAQLVRKNHGAWYVRLDERVVENGVIRRRQPWKWLGRVEDYPKIRDIEPLALRELERANEAARCKSPAIGIVEFYENVYLPAMEKKLAASTVKGYSDAWRCHIRERVQGRVRDFRAVDGENLMEAIEATNGTKLAHATYRHIKVTLSAMFTFARRKGFYDGVNPMTGVSIPKGKKYGRKKLFYGLDEVEVHLQAFNDDLRVQAIIGTAAFTGLRHGEIRGLCCEDDEGEILNIRRSVWRTIVKDSKTGEDAADPGVVPIIAPLRHLLDQVKPAGGWLFPNTIGGALDLHNLVNRVIKPRFAKLGIEWKGWHAYRRGLATNLHELGVDDKTIQAILRHQDVGTTQSSYIITPTSTAIDAMAKFESRISTCVAPVWQAESSRMVN